MYLYFFPEDVKIRILDHFLFIEAERKTGVKGVNLTSHKFKSCIKLRKNVGASKVRAFYHRNMLRITTKDVNLTREIELTVDKRQARKPPPAPEPPKFDRKTQENYERFVQALK